MQEYKRLSPRINGLFTSLIEVWKDIEGHEGAYQISSYGRVKSVARTRTGRDGAIVPVSERIMKTKTSKTGYLVIGLHSVKKKFYSIHRLVAKAFIPNSENKETVNHIDGDKKNNNVSNLEWSTHKEQVEHALATGLMVNTGKIYEKKFKKDILQYSKDNPDLSVRDLSLKFDVSERTIGRILNLGVTPRMVGCSTNNGHVYKKSNFQ